MGPQFLFMDDNATPHRTEAATKLLENEDIQRLDWLASFPDLNPIKRVWGALRRYFVARHRPPANICSCDWRYKMNNGT